MTTKILQVFLLLLFFTACKEEPKEEELLLTFETTSVVKKSGKGCHTEEFNCTEISLDIPTAQGPEDVAENINERLQEHVFSLNAVEEPSKASTYEEYAKEFIASHQDVASEFQESAPWKAFVTGSILSQRENLISLALDSEIFTGGAHGYRSLRFFNFDPQTGEEYSKNDLFKEDFLAFAEQAFRKKYEISLDASINSTGLWFEEDKFKLPRNIGFGAEELILVYNTYEISSYVEGEFRLELPLENVQEYLKITLE